MNAARPVPSSAPVPPQDLEAEESVLGAMMLSPGAIEKVRGEVERADFYRESHGTIFAGAVEMYERGNPVDAITLADELDRRGQLDGVGGRVRIHELAALVPATANVAHYARIVRRAARDREQFAALAAAQAAVLNGGLGPADRARVTAALAEERGGQARARIVALGEFVATKEDLAEPLLGTEEGAVLPAGGLLVVYGDGGAGKTTLSIDAVVHLASGAPWLGIPVPRPLRILVVENEGPRAEFRRKLYRKVTTWTGAAFEHNVFVYEEPWARVTFASEHDRAALAGFVSEHEIDLIVAGPVKRLGMAGGGTPDEVTAFSAQIVALRAKLDRPLALWLVHHENKGGEISGAWEGEPDTLLRVTPDEPHRTLLRWQKVRWASETHGTSMVLRWVTDCDGFELVETADKPERDYKREVLEFVAATNRPTGTDIVTGVGGNEKTVRDAIKRLRGEGRIREAEQRPNVNARATCWEAVEESFPDVGKHPEALSPAPRSDSASDSPDTPVGGGGREGLEGRPSESPSGQPGPVVDDEVSTVAAELSVEAWSESAAAE